MRPNAWARLYNADLDSLRRPNAWARHYAADLDNQRMGQALQHQT